ncbi:tetratricopeptide repeat protein [Lacticaseibacillus baoqingensis]|uniref:Tetratricopeptide repeat protein n=1 Tax=Lacticaseibacillus baoqingensis TaxID=2486013 RepID=A0ABW4EA49_9LACO|nr:tetratricopeptide repeat protein [Lacticaseibacillus baoqingensis]
MSYSKEMLDALERGDMADAKAFFKDVLAHDDDETKYNLAEELYALGFIGQAQRLYQELLGKYPDQDDIKTMLADIAVSNGDSDQALNYLAQVGPDSDAYVQALMTAADVYQTQGLYEVSEQKLLEARQLAPDELVITFALGELYFAWGKDDQAALAYSDLIQAGVAEMAGVSVKSRYAATLANMGQYEDAVAVYEDLKDALDVNDAFTLGSLYAQLKDYPRAIDALQRVITEDASYANAYLPLAQAQAADHQGDAALTTVQAGLQVDDTNPELFALGAQLALKADDQPLARTYLQKARKLDPENQTVMLAWSNLLLAEGADQDNVAFLEAIDKSGEVDPQIYWNLAKSYDRLDQPQQARENYLLAFGRFQDSRDFLLDIIDFFQSTAAIPELKAAMTRYLALVPDDAAMQARLDELNAEA